MGAGQTQLKKEELDALQKATHFTPKELRAMFAQFRKESPQGFIGRVEFREVMRQMGVSDEFLQNVLFNAFDDNKDGQINFQEFVCSLSVMTKGQPDEKLEFAFQLYDLDGNGYIERDEMVRISEAFAKLVGPLVSFSGKKHPSTQALVEEFFDSMDTNCDGRVSLQEYKQGALRNPDIIQGLKLFS
eukprot:TRINITY_DN10216_c0_g1_i1.p1 TRINITY_DN10216_c0_g1~~TRINITY_DN10216_c0_g1_i1.p1  ORF type:complete len:187 (-),score=63.95 TRINITY_DN10216_c0_g1_i1:148-708(-)